MYKLKYCQHIPKPTINQCYTDKDMEKKRDWRQTVVAHTFNPSIRQVGSLRVSARIDMDTQRNFCLEKKERKKNRE